MSPYEIWYKRFKGALEALESRQQQQQSPLPVIYQWQQPQPANSASKCAPAKELLSLVVKARGSLMQLRSTQLQHART